MTQSTHSLRQPISIALLLAMLLVQAYLLYHETVHAAAGESESCLVCQLAQEQGNAIISVALIIAAGIFVRLLHKVPTFLLSVPLRYFPARAPPALIDL